MAATQLGIYQEALRVIGERKLASLTEDRLPRHLLDDVWNNDAIKRLLEMGLWNFATRTVQASYNPSIAPGFGLRRAYDKPTDWVRTVQLADDEYFNSPVLDYHDEGLYLYTDYQIIYWRYVSDDSAYGADLSLWPPSFARFVAHYFAWEIAPSMTDSEKKLERIKKDYKRVRVQARSIDAINQPPGFPPMGQWSSSRTYGTRTRRDRGSRGSLTG